MSRKVALLPEYDRKSWAPPGHKHPIDVKRMAPLASSSPFGYVHRPRSAVVWPDGRLSIRFWCGVHAGSKRSVLLFDLPEGREVCGTCEGRAIGAGQIPNVHGVEPLIFSPRRREKCEWEARTNGYGYCSYYTCGVTAKATASLGDLSKYVCTRHRMSAISKGWHIEDFERLKVSA